MAMCPVCEANIVDDFGLIECGRCGAQLIVHVDGTVEHSGADASSEPAQVDGNHSDEVFDSGEEGLEALSKGTFEQAVPALDEDTAEQAEAPASDEALLSFDEPQEQPAQVYVPPGAAADSPDLSDIARFGNSDASSSREGSLRYNLQIGGIDTADVREAFREAITDRKFMWDVDQILRGIRNGEVLIQNVAATKAHMLVSRLRELPVRVRWEQYAIQQA